MKSVLRVCAVCEGSDLRTATYDSPLLATGLPALACGTCGNLELDDRRAGRIAEILGVPTLSRLHGAELRAEVRRWLKALQPFDAHPGAARGGARLLAPPSCRYVS